jgi:hypothetical protein
VPEVLSRYLFIQLLFFLLPFVIFAIWRYATRNTRDTKKAWPLNVLFVSGIGLGIAAWIVLIVNEPKLEREMCVEPAKVVDGELVPARQVPCSELEVIETDASGDKAARGFSGDAGDRLKTIEDMRRNPEGRVPEDSVSDPLNPAEDVPEDDGTQ